jgi:hypothetical protein
VIFTSNRNGPDDLYWRPVDGSGADELLYASSAVKRPTDVSASGTLLFTVRSGPGGNSLDIWGMPLGEAATAAPVIASPGGSIIDGISCGDCSAEAGRPTNVYCLGLPSISPEVPCASGSQVRRSRPRSHLRDQLRILRRE